MRRAADELKRYFGERIWRSDDGAASMPDRIARRVSRYLYLIVRGCFDDSVLVRAPALTLTSLFALVPLLALALAVAARFDLQQFALEALRRLLTDYVTAGQHDVVEVVIGYVERTRLGAIGGVGLLFLLWASLTLMSAIEDAFNSIWGVEASRPLGRRVAIHLGILLIVPVLLLASTGLNAALGSAALIERVSNIALFSGALELGLQLAPFVVLTVGFTFLYRYTPYAAVRNRAAWVAGCFTGVGWHVAQWVFIQLQIGVTHNNLIYGTLAALPIFLIWLNLSWVIVLVGCEIAYAVQHEATYRPPHHDVSISLAERERMALRILGQIRKRDLRGDVPLTSGDLAAEFDVPRPVTVEILRAMLDAGLLMYASSGHEGLVPAGDLRERNVGEILLAFRHARGAHADATAPNSDPRVVLLHRQLEQALDSAGSQRFDLAFPRDEASR